MADEHGSCHNCGLDFNGDYIWDTGFKFAVGKGFDGLEALAEADRYAECYGATRGKGRWGKQIGIYNLDRDRTTHYQCPSCEHRIERK